MTLRLIEGFDHFDPNTKGSLKGWNTLYASTGASVNQVAGRLNGNAVKLTGVSGNDFWWGKTLPSVYASIVVGLAVQTTILPSSTTGFFYLKDTTLNTTVAGLWLQTNGKLVVVNSAGTQIGVGSTVLAINTWYYIELKIFLNGASGTCELHLNGVTEIAQTTGNFGSLGIGSLMMLRNGAGVGNPGNMSFDDIYFLDTVGSANLNFLGDVHVETIYPSADGTHSQWTPNSGVTHYNRVNETNPDDDTTYNSDANVGDIDSYQYTDLTIPAGTVFAVQTNLWSRKDDATTRQVKSVVRTGGSDYTPGSLQTLTTGYVDYTDILETNPAAASGTLWTVSDINGAEFGVKVIT